MEKIIVAFESEKTALRVKELLEGGGAVPYYSTNRWYPW